jgi:FkbM family methyltransferase
MQLKFLDRLVQRAAARGLLPPWGSPAHHPVFAAFPPPHVVQDGSLIDFVASHTRPDMLPEGWTAPPEGTKLNPPPFDEEYFEWIDLLETVMLAREQFTMLELGAGYGRWAARGALAARRRGLAVRLGVVEAEPQHVIWLREHLALNGIATREYRLFEAAVSDEPGTTVFYVAMPEGYASNSAREWYGQAIAGSAHEAAEADVQELYCGRPLIALPAGWKGVEVPLITVAKVLEHYDLVDLADLDVQGEEAKVIRAGIEVVSRKVRRLHIGTHGRDIESELRETLRSAGWQCLRDYACQQWNRTPFGWLQFGDGVQSWINPRLIGPSG